MMEIVENDKNRVSNLVWTITKKYDKDVDYRLLQEEYFDYDVVYNAIIIGSLYKILDYDMIYSFLDFIKLNINKSKDIINLFFICVEETCITKNIHNIQNIRNIRYETYKNIKRNYTATSKQDKLYNILRIAYWNSILNNTIIAPKEIKKIIGSVETFGEVSDTVEFIEKFKCILSLYFNFEAEKEKDLLDKLDKSNIEKHEEKRKKSTSDKEAIYEFFSEYTSSEFNPNETILEKNFSKDSSIMEDMQENNNEYEFLLKMEKNYGKISCTLKELHRLEEIYCINTHKGYKLFLTQGVPEDITDEYRKNQILTQKQKNIDEYMNNEVFYKRQIDLLKNSLKKLIYNTDKIELKSYSGKINSKKIYRAEKLNDFKIFQKEINRDKNEFVVDIIIDSSASLLEKQSILSSQSYVISKALEDLGIKNSVTTFNSFMDYSVIKTLKKYEDSSSQRCFDYFCSGGNRDGLAIDVIGSLTTGVNDYKKIMILFTDAKPFDVQVLKTIGVKSKKAYQGDLALKDTARAVNSLKRRDVKICGVFSDKENNIPNLKYIYNKDFIYIDDVKLFSAKVGKFIGKCIIESYE